MIRSASKNFRDVAVVVSPSDYDRLTEELRASNGQLSLRTRQGLALKAFTHTSAYDSAIADYLRQNFSPESASADTGDARELFPPSIELTLNKVNDLRYGENPHQRAAVYSQGGRQGIAGAELLGGKEMSYNNYIDADAAWALVNEFSEPACAIIKHTNPAGTAIGQSAVEAYRRALETDPVSAFGGIVAFNTPVELEAARAVTEIFTEVVIAPEYSDEALEQFATKKNLRVLKPGMGQTRDERRFTTISGGVLVQTADRQMITASDLKYVTARKPTAQELESLLFAWKVSKHTKSNAIVYARNGQTVGVGAGQMSRIDSVKIGAMRARIPVPGSVIASDAFFPFRDGIDEAAKFGITAIIQPGGSVRDSEVIDAANEHNIAMVFTGYRHFKH
jgi:phosphoribosylaminoimidazolecarboxamide formyltransferase / IMP cyclohydrolase